MGSIVVTGLTEALRGTRKSAGVLDRALGDTLHQALPSSAGGEMRGRAHGMGAMEGRASSGIEVSQLANGVKVSAGGGDPFFHGSEFGGRKRGKRPYFVSSPRGRGYIVRKKATMMFAPFVGKTGYFVTPVTKRHLQGIRAKLTERIIREVSS